MKWSTSYAGPGKGRAGTKGIKLVRKWGYRKKLFTSIFVTEKTKIPLFFVNTFI